MDNVLTIDTNKNIGMDVLNPNCKLTMYEKRWGCTGIGIELPKHKLEITNKESGDKENLDFSNVFVCEDGYIGIGV